MRARPLLMLFAAGTLLGCGSDSSTPTGGPSDYHYDGGTSGGGSSESTRCEFPSGGENASATITAQGSWETVHEMDGEAQNQMQLAGPLPEEPTRVIARGPCGTVGLLLRKPGSEALEYVDVTQGVGEPEVVEPTSGARGVSLLFDDACTAIAVHASTSAGYRSWERGSAGAWQPVPVAEDLAQVLGEEPSGVSHRWAGRTSDGTLHVLATANVSDGTVILHGHRSAEAGSAWTVEAPPAPSGQAPTRMAAGPGGALHAVFQLTEYPCDPCNLDLYYGRLGAGESTWTTTTVQAGMWGPPHDEEAIDPSLVVDAEGKPWIAASFERRSVTGSVTSAELRLYGLRADTWCHEAPVLEADDYAGGDGDGFTGARPQLWIDGAGRKHVLFNDMSVWHDEQGWANTSVGQVRYAVRTGDRWSVETLMTQPGQTASPQPLHGVAASRFVVSEDGTAFWVVATESTWETDSIYNDMEVPMTLRTSVLSGAVAISP